MNAFAPVTLHRSGSGTPLVLLHCLGVDHGSGISLRRLRTA